ncbi:MAG: LAGLIDADG family homing endonuclease [Candidatus Paceibacteria bacterium]
MVTPDYIVGLVDGEGSFTVHIPTPEQRRKAKRRARAEPRFYIKLAEKDREILEDIKDFFGCGSIYLQKDSRENHADCYRYEVASGSDIVENIIPFFIEHPLRLPSKQKDLEIFRKLIALMEEGRHLSEEGLDKMYENETGDALDLVVSGKTADATGTSILSS